MSGINYVRDIDGLDLRLADVLATTITSAELAPVPTIELDQLIVSSERNHSLATTSTTSIVRDAVQNLCRRWFLLFDSSSSTFSSFVTTTRPFTAAVAAPTLAFIVIIIVIMCTLTLLYYPCRHKQPIQTFCKDAVSHKEFLNRHRGRRSLLQRRRHSVLQPTSPGASRTTAANEQRSGRGRSISRCPSRSPSRSRASQSSQSSGSMLKDSSSSSSSSMPPSSPRLRPNRVIQNRGERKILCGNYRTLHTETSALCFKKADCQFERVRRCWRCCRCGHGPNRDSRCISFRYAEKPAENSSSPNNGTICKHHVCSDCAEYVFPPIPVYNAELGDWIKPAATSSIVRVMDDEGDDTESDEENRL